jgi:hypothetical protein
MMYQQIVMGVGWANKPTTHSEKLSLIHAVPMAKPPDNIGISQTNVIGSATMTASTSSRFDTILTATGVTRDGSPPYLVRILPVTLSLEVSYCGVGHRSLPAGYVVT